jgi:hypothetical protein
VVFITPITDEADSGELDQAEEAGFDAGQLASDLAGRRDVRRSSRRGDEAEELRRLAEGVRQLALHVAGPDDVSEPVAGGDVERGASWRATSAHG